MAILNHEKKEVVFKVVYCGPAMSGKSTNFRFIVSKIDGARRSDPVSFTTSTDRILTLDLLPPEAVTLTGYRTRIRLYAVQGQAFYDATRQLVLRGVDGIVFVADSRPQFLEANLREFQATEACIALNGSAFDRIPIVLQYNKRDAADAVALDLLESWLNGRERRLTSFEAVATRGHNVFATLNAVSQLVFHRFHQVIGASASPPGDSREPGPSTVANRPVGDSVAREDACEPAANRPASAVLVG